MIVTFESTLAFIIILNIVGFLLIRADKMRLKNKEPRIKEVLLFVVAGLSGGIGEYLAMLILRHKTYKWYFKVFMPIIVVFNIIVSSLVLFLIFEAGKTGGIGI
ncbi:MAG: DUF1294 domain-containing protein [Clostridia bacterium]|nr:DUF1294 domain-containing protein [Clostridia bacterium]